MKEHNFIDPVPCFGVNIYECATCGCTKMDNENKYFANFGDFRIVSKCCNRALRQIEQYEKQDALKEKLKWLKIMA